MQRYLAQSKHSRSRKHTLRRALLLVSLALGAAACAAASASGARHEAALEKMRAKFRSADVDHDGFLSRDEAAAGMPRVAKHFDAADSDHDNRLSQAEIAAWIAQARAARN